MIEIFLAESKDLQDIQQLAERIWWPTYRGFLEEGQIQYMLNHMYSVESLGQQQKQGNIFAFIRDQDGLLGFTSYRLEHLETPAKVRIEKLYILPQSQGKNLGSRLIHHITQYAYQHECSVLELNVNRNNPAIGFYQKQGFKVIESLDIPYGPYMLNDFVMQKELAEE